MNENYIKNEELEKISHLAQLSIPQSDPNLPESGLSFELNKILKYFDQISVVETNDIEPLFSPLENESVFRSDEVFKVINEEELIKQAPSRTGNLFTVPPVV